MVSFSTSNSLSLSSSAWDIGARGSLPTIQTLGGSFPCNLIPLYPQTATSTLIFIVQKRQLPIRKEREFEEKFTNNKWQSQNDLQKFCHEEPGTWTIRVCYKRKCQYLPLHMPSSDTIPLLQDRQGFSKKNPLLVVERGYLYSAGLKC